MLCKKFYSSNLPSSTSATSSEDSLLLFLYMTLPLQPISCTSYAYQRLISYDLNPTSCMPLHHSPYMFPNATVSNYSGYLCVCISVTSFKIHIFKLKSPNI